MVIGIGAKGQLRTEPRVLNEGLENQLEVDK